LLKIDWCSQGSTRAARDRGRCGRGRSLECQATGNRFDCCRTYQCPLHNYSQISNKSQTSQNLQRTRGNSLKRWRFPRLTLISFHRLPRTNEEKQKRHDWVHIRRRRCGSHFSVVGACSEAKSCEFQTEFFEFDGYSVKKAYFWAPRGTSPWVAKTTKVR
jgi:hypothetical protein